jgi:hypothetical protein
VIPALSRETRRCVLFTARSTQHNACNKAGRNPDCTEDIARTPEFVGGIPGGGDLGDDTLDHRAGDGPGMRARFHPSVTALVLHQGRADQTRDHEAELSQLRRHSFCHAAQVRGAERCGCRDCMIDKGRAPQPMSSRCAAIGRPVPCVGSMSSPPRSSQTYDQPMKVETIVSEWPMSVQYLPLSGIGPAALFFTTNQWTWTLDVGPAAP